MRSPARSVSSEVTRSRRCTRRGMAAALVRPTSRRDHIAPFVAEWRGGSRRPAGARGARRRRGGGHPRRRRLGRAPIAGRAQLPAQRAGVVATARGLRDWRAWRKFLFVSSVAVYHDILQDRKLDENHPTWPQRLRRVQGRDRAAPQEYHFTYGMNTSSWRPAAVYGVDPNLRIAVVRPDQGRQGRRCDRHAPGREDHARAGRRRRARRSPSATRRSPGSSTTWSTATCTGRARPVRQGADRQHRDDHRPQGRGPKNKFDTSKAIDFFDRHGNTPPFAAASTACGHDARELLTKA